MKHLVSKIRRAIFRNSSVPVKKKSPKPKWTVIRFKIDDQVIVNGLWSKIGPFLIKEDHYWTKNCELKVGGPKKSKIDRLVLTSWTNFWLQDRPILHTVNLVFWTD